MVRFGRCAVDGHLAFSCFGRSFSVILKKSGPSPRERALKTIKATLPAKVEEAKRQSKQMRTRLHEGPGVINRGEGTIVGSPTADTHQVENTLLFSLISQDEAVYDWLVH